MKEVIMMPTVLLMNKMKMDVQSILKDYKLINTGNVAYYLKM